MSDQPIRIVVHPPTVPTTSSPFHESATHVDALGMPVAFSQPFPEDRPWPYHPTPCCGASASISDGPMYCKACYEEVDDAYGNVPLEPFRSLDREDWPVHQPDAPEAPIPGRHWYQACDPDLPRVSPFGVCESCGGVACPVCGRENCPDDHEQEGT